MKPEEYTYVITFEPVALENDKGEVCFKSKSTKELIRCRDCDHHMGKFCWCSLHRSYMEDEDFCSKAVPKERRERER